jgi:hypothetical protein
VVEAWNKGLVGMCEGERRRLIVPWDLGYGTKGGKGVPPYSELQYDFELQELSGVKTREARSCSAPTVVAVAREVAVPLTRARRFAGSDEAEEEEEEEAGALMHGVNWPQACRQPAGAAARATRQHMCRRRDCRRPGASQRVLAARILGTRV